MSKISKKRIHQLTRMGGIESDRRQQNKINTRFVKESEKGIGIIPVKVKRENRISLRIQGKIAVETPTSIKESLSNCNMDIVKSLRTCCSDSYVGKKKSRILKQLRKQYMKNINNIPVMRERIKRNPLLEKAELVRSSDHQVNSTIAKRLKRRLKRMGKKVTRITMKGRTIVIPPMN
jgi:hypothetical protein